MIGVMYDLEYDFENNSFLSLQCEMNTYIIFLWNKCIFFVKFLEGIFKLQLPVDAQLLKRPRVLDEKCI